jgi:ATPase family associated with various cellular activities (AAA)
MDHFDIVLALARAALSSDPGQARHQVERLREQLTVLDPPAAAKLERLLSRQERRHFVAPMAIEQMRTNAKHPRLPGEKLSRNTPLPHDRETGSPLIRVIFPDENIGMQPLLSEELSAAIRDLIGEWSQVEQLAALGVQPNLRCLLYGQPGVGKTMLARYIASVLNLPIVEARLDGLVSSFLGTTARNIGALFDFADRYQCVLFLDEFDAIAKARDDHHEVGEIKRVVNSLLQSLDARGSRGFTLAATNHEHLLDAAVWRRFEARIRIAPPDLAARISMLQRFLQPLILTQPELKVLAWVTKGMTGADIETLIIGGKRFLVMQDAGKASGSGGATVMAALRRQATLNGQLFHPDTRDLLLGPADALTAALVDDAGLTQKEAGELLGLSQSTVSRRRREIAVPLEGERE